MPAPSSAWARPVLFRVAVAALGIACGVVLIEVLGRIAFGFKPPPTWAQAFAGAAGYELHPGEMYTYASASGEFETVVRHNSRGLRDVEHARHKASGVYRILILCDSFAHAQEVPLEDSFPRRLEVLLNQAAPNTPRIEVINGGHAGLGTAQEYLYYALEGRQYEPDLVLLGVYLGNDLVDNHAPLARAWLERTTLESPYFTPDGTLQRPGLAPSRRLLRWLRYHSYTANVLARVWSRGGRADRIVVGTLAGVAPTVDPRARRVPLGLYLPPDGVWRDAWAVTYRAFAALKRAVDDDGRRLAAFVIPDRRQLGGEAWDAALAELPDADRARADRDRPQCTMLALLGKAHVPALDLLAPFRETPAPIYLPRDGHLNPAGHEVAAQAMAFWLRNARLVPVPSSRSATAPPLPASALSSPRSDPGRVGPDLPPATRAQLPCGSSSPPES